MAGITHPFRSLGSVFPAICPHVGEKNAEVGIPVLLELVTAGALAP